MKRMRGTKILEGIGKIAPVVFTILICSLPILPLGHAEALKETDEKEGEYWESTNPNFPFTLVDWQLVTNPHSSDKYMDKHIIGRVKNTSEREFSGVKMEFSVYDEKGAQIAIVFSNLYDFKPSGIWKFEILVSDDVEKASIKGLYGPSKELKEMEGQLKRKGMRKDGNAF